MAALASGDLTRGATASGLVIKAKAGVSGADLPELAAKGTAGATAKAWVLKLVAEGAGGNARGGWTWA